MSERSDILVEVDMERDRQDRNFGQRRDHPDGTSEHLTWYATKQRLKTELAAAEGRLTWRHIMDEEWAEACAESDAAKIRAELIQVAAVAVAWIEAIDRRAGPVLTAG